MSFFTMNRMANEIAGSSDTTDLLTEIRRTWRAEGQYRWTVTCNKASASGDSVEEALAKLETQMVASLQARIQRAEENIAAARAVLPSSAADPEKP